MNINIFLISFAVMIIVVAAMAVGAMFTGRPIKGSCGGMGTDEQCPCSEADKQACEAKKLVQAAQERAAQESA